MFGITVAAIAATLMAATAALAADPVPTRAAALEPDWSGTVRDWTARAERGDHDAPARLCALYFDGGGGRFDPAATATWCRRAAELHDARSMLEMGFLALAGVGTRKDLDQAADLCARAASHDAALSTGFCVAAVASERRRSTGSTDGAPPAGPPALAAAATSRDPDVTAKLTQWRDLADRGDSGASANLCAFYFEAGDVAFDAAKAADWCRRAATYGDARSMRHLGMMRLWGVGMEKSSPQAEALCGEAESRDPSISAAFCVAAVKSERALANADSEPSGFVYPQPWPGASDPKQVPAAMAPDRVLESTHVTATGLRYTCRELIDWSRYGLHLNAEAFGRPLLQYREQDYTSLDRAASECAAAIAHSDEDGSQQRQLAEFQRTLPLVRKRQGVLAAEAQEHQAWKGQRDSEARELARGFSVMEADSNLSDLQRQCIDTVRRAWLAREFSPGARAIEIRFAATNQVNGNSVVSVGARVISDLIDAHTSANVYSCTFDGQSGRMVAKTIAQVAQLPAAPPR